MAKDKEGYDLKTYRVVWRVEIGSSDGGLGPWEKIVETHPFPSKKEAKALEQKWLKEGKLEKMQWGKLRPAGMIYGDYRIYCREELTEETTND